MDKGIDSETILVQDLGSNLLGASLTVPLLDITYQFITTEQQEDINEV